jgi:hypothetical protein
MTRRQFVLSLLCVAMVAVAVAWVAGRQSPVGTAAAPRSLDAVRLGPDPGQPVAEYLAGLPAHLPLPGTAGVLALVQFGDELDPTDAVTLLVGAGATPEQVVFRVPLPRVQTALRFERLPTVDLVDPVAAARRRLALAQQSAQRDAEAESATLAGRQAQLARYEAGALAGRGRCVLAMLVLGDRAALTRLAARPGVRAVDAAPEDTPVTGVALVPLLPEQSEVAGPVPDDGPVPAGPGQGPR